VNPRGQSTSRLARLRRTLYLISAGAALWSVTVAVTGGVAFRVFGWRVSSRQYRDPLVVALLALVTTVALAWRVDGSKTLRHEWRWLTALAPAGLRVARIAPAVVAAIGILLAIYQWSYPRPLWFDEEAILLNVRDRSWSGLGGTLWLGQSAPFGWLVAERAAMVTLGTSEVALRFVPLLFGIATIVAALWISYRWMSPIGGVVLVLLCAFAPDVSHFVFETKHYSADTFGGTFLPGLAVWTTEGSDVATRGRRSLVWWIAAACGQMLATGALLVAPACALFLAAWTWRRDGLRAAAWFALSGVIFLVAFGVHYDLSLRATQENQYLHQYWSTELPPPTMGLVDRARWIVDRLEPLALNPAGTTWGLALWLVAAAGLALGGRLVLGLPFALAPASAFVLAGLGIVPLYQRFMLWIVPALYVGLALVVERASRITWDAYRRRSWAPLVLAAPGLVFAGGIAFNIVTRGTHEIAGRMPVPNHKHQFDDRAAVRWLMDRVRPGDAIVTTHLAWAAIWWYGGMSIAEPPHHPSGAPLLEVDLVGPGQCSDDRFREDLEKYQRVAVYVGFDTPPGFDYLLLHALDELGAIEAFSEYAERGRAAIFDLRSPIASQLTLQEVSPKTIAHARPIEGCPRLAPARRW
jgi:hypothetical protein